MDIDIQILTLTFHNSIQITRKIREAIWIRRRGSKTMNRDVGGITLVSLDHVYNSPLKTSRAGHRILEGKLPSNSAGKAVIQISCDQVIIP